VEALLLRLEPQILVEAVEAGEPAARSQKLEETEDLELLLFGTLDLNVVLAGP
jgi:hypothetical protein